MACRGWEIVMAIAIILVTLVVSIICDVQQNWVNYLEIEIWASLVENSMNEF